MWFSWRRDQQDQQRTRTRPREDDEDGSSGAGLVAERLNSKASFSLIELSWCTATHLHEATLGCGESEAKTIMYR